MAAIFKPRISWLFKFNFRFLYLVSLPIFDSLKSTIFPLKKYDFLKYKIIDSILWLPFLSHVFRGFSNLIFDFYV